MLSSIHDLLLNPTLQTLLAVHPNDPKQTNSMVLGDADDPGLVPAIRAAQLPRPPVHLPISIPQPLFGMSPKKYHECFNPDLFRALLSLPATHPPPTPALRLRVPARRTGARPRLPRIHPAARQLPTETGSTPTLRRLGRLPDADWSTFLARARERLAVDFPHDPCQREPPFTKLQVRLAALHVRRCLLGPVVESYIVLDRVQWIQEELKARRERYGGDDFLAACTIEVVNLFDQATGSGRNIPLVLALIPNRRWRSVPAEKPLTRALRMYIVSKYHLFSQSQQAAACWHMLQKLTDPSLNVELRAVLFSCYLMRCQAGIMARYNVHYVLCTTHPW
ncbi:hypothetical protein H0H81_002294 [Sphagnurus paluster]|uniref:Uncharacterized protein n=1 Tax=Sphagnurus paluster TaxID=117069 RepID=A0A9P7FY48_9AGAR|nr:hypothetical protein H0H81_002294 [Sphagnurus paluster]